VEETPEKAGRACVSFTDVVNFGEQSWKARPDGEKESWEKDEGG